MIYTDKMIVHKDCNNNWVRDSLLRHFLTSHKKSLKFSVSFVEYTFDEFPDQTELFAFIDKEYRNKYGELYWSGDKYDTLKELIQELKEQKNIFRIIVDYTEN